jgi:Pentapeptide repeats (8 copies)
MSEPRNVPALAHPLPDGFASWPGYWTAQGMPWRTEPEIDEQRQAYLAERRTVASDIERGIYPFRDVNGSIELTRADGEWLLATHESGGMRGPVDWSDEKQRRRTGLDLRGADLRGIDLSHLPLARLRGGPTADEWRSVSLPKSQLGALRLDRADLYGTQLQGASLREAEMQGVVLWEAEMQGAYSRDAQLQGAYLYAAQLQGADLRGARLDSATVLTAITLDEETRLADVLWNGAPLQRVRWEQTSMLGDESEARRPREPDGSAKDAGRRLWPPFRAWD